MVSKGFSSLVAVCLLALFSKAEYTTVAKNSAPFENFAQRAKEVAEHENFKEAAERAEKERIQREKEETERKRIEPEQAEKERIRREKEAAELAERNHLARRVRLVEDTVERDLAAIRKCYADGKRYLNPFLGKDHSDDDRRIDWLSKWAEPRLPLSEADAQEGNTLLSEFAIKYLPNAYANYEKKREALLVFQQVFNEEFPEPWTIKKSDSKWVPFNKVLEKFVMSRIEYFICHDELCHYWHMYRFGVLGVEDLAQVDAKPLAVPLYCESYKRVEYLVHKVNPFEEKVRDFAVKYAPESNTIYQKMEREFKQLDALIKEILIARRKMDCVRYSGVLNVAIEKRNELVREMNALSKSLASWYLEHKIMEKTSDDVTSCDNNESKRLKPFVARLPLYIKKKILGESIISNTFSNKEMIAIPGRKYMIQRTEVTQTQWEIVMGNNPSKFKDPNRPVENVSWDDCQEFIEKLNEIEGENYRLPTEEEWEYACRAGSPWNFGECKNGREGAIDDMGWYDNNSGGETHGVAQKVSNAWGLYDMHGNVGEWCQNKTSYKKCVWRGGSYTNSARECTAHYYNTNWPHDRNSHLGFRLALSLD